MGTTRLEQELETYKRRIEIMERALSASAGAYYNINITQNRIPGMMCQVIDGAEYSINEAIGFPNDCKYTDVIEYLGNRLDKDARKDFFAFFELENLKKCFERGEDHICHLYQARDILGNPMLAEQHVVMYRDLAGGDLLAVTYVLDHTEIEELHIRDMEQKRRLEEDIIQIEGLASQYSTLYFVNLETEEYSRYSVGGSIRWDGVDDRRKTLNNFFQLYTSVIQSFCHPDHREEILKYANAEYVREVLHDRIRHSHRFLQKNKDGEYIWLELVLIKLNKAEEEPVHIAFAFLKVDEEEREKEVQRKVLTEALATAEHANRAKTIFLSNMSHDIRTPMNAIIGYTALAASHIGDEAAIKNYLEKISTSSNHLLGLINDILDMSRIENGRVQIEEMKVNLPGILRDLRSIIQSGISSKQQELILDAQEIVNENVITDKLRLNQVLLNIAGNAIKFTPVGGTIHIRVSEKPCALSGYATYEFCIRDNGIGMSEEFQKHIFEAFERERSTTVSGIQGTGLGMAITKRIVDMMDGHIRVKSEEGKGTEFVVVLDFKLADTDAKCEPVSEEQKPQKACFAGKRILLVEDNIINQEIAAEILEEYEFIVEVAQDGIEAVEKVTNADSGYYDLILMDVQMPRMDGFTATREIRTLSDNRKANIPIVAMTANAFAEDRKSALGAGMNGFVAKPFDVDEMMEALAEMLR